MKKLLLSALLSLGFLTIPFTNAEAATTKDQLIVNTQLNKIKNRPYYTGKIKGGDPRNPLGDRWLGLNMAGTYGTTYAIHGTNNNQAIGKWTTLGCIRMYNNDIHWLFERIPQQATVTVK